MKRINFTKIFYGFINFQMGFPKSFGFQVYFSITSTLFSFFHLFDLDRSTSLPVMWAVSKITLINYEILNFLKIFSLKLSHQFKIQLWIFKLTTEWATVFNMMEPNTMLWKLSSIKISLCINLNGPLHWFKSGSWELLLVHYCFSNSPTKIWEWFLKHFSLNRNSTLSS